MEGDFAILQPDIQGVFYHREETDEWIRFEDAKVYKIGRPIAGRLLPYIWLRTIALVRIDGELQVFQQLEDNKWGTVLYVMKGTKPRKPLQRELVMFAIAELARA